MIEEKVECKRLGYEYKDLISKVVYLIHRTPYAKEFISDNDLKMLSDLDLFLHTEKYEIIEFGTNKTKFDSTDIIATQKEKIEELKNRVDLLKDINNKQKEVLDKIKEKIKTYPHISYASVEKVDGKRLSGQLIPVTEILELLEEIE